MGCNCFKPKQSLGIDYVDLDKLKNKNTDLIKKHSSLGSPNFLFSRSDNSTNIYNPSPLLTDAIKTAMVSEINLARGDPVSYISKVEKYARQVRSFEGVFFIAGDERNNIRLKKGKVAFEKCILFLRRQRPLKGLKLLEELVIPFPEKEDECESERFLTQQIMRKSEELKKRNLKIVNFHYDIMTSKVEMSVVLQVVDDTNAHCQRRMNIFSKEAENIGMNVRKFRNGVFCYYLLFAKGDEM